MTAPRPDTGRDALTRMHRASALKERIYVAFTTLAVIIALRAHDHHPTAGIALGTLAITVTATICAVYVAGLLSHMVIHEQLPTSGEHRRMIADTFGAGTVAVPPVICLIPAHFGLYDTATGLVAAMLVTTCTLAAVGILAVRRLSVPRGQRLAILTAHCLLALAVIALELLSHR